MSTPTLRALTELAQDLFSRRPDLQERFGQIDSLAYWIWLMSEGLRTEPQLQRLMPLPPGPLMRRVVGEGVTDEFFRKSGLNQAREFYGALTEAGVDFGHLDSLLDFGCGCGRVLRFFARFAPGCRLFGGDVDAEAVAWCRENLDYAEFQQLSSTPPTPWPEGGFDAAYAYSVFSHLPESLHLNWLQELRRVTRPGGHIAVTTQGQHLFARARAGDLDVLDESPEQVATDSGEFHDRGFLFYPYRFDTPWMPEELADSYGMTFIDESYVRRTWGKLFEIVSFAAAPSDYQDVVVLRRPHD